MVWLPASYLPAVWQASCMSDAPDGRGNGAKPAKNKPICDFGAARERYC
jgi:hypothetical protein